MGRAWAVGRAPVLLLLVAAAACGGRGVGSSGDPDAGGAVDGAVPDAVAAPDAAAGPDATVGDCECPTGQVYRHHPCLATLDLGCGDPCDPGGTDCAEGWTCDPCGASTSCATFDCQPTCVFTGPAMGPVPEPLRIWPTSGAAGETTEVLVMGFPWYVGALWYGVRVDDETVDNLSDAAEDCSFSFTAPARPPGRVAVLVSQYGGGEPWVLAGFFTYSAGDIDDCVQPGYACGVGDTCCSTSAVPVTCHANRCERQ